MRGLKLSGLLSVLLCLAATYAQAAFGPVDASTGDLPPDSQQLRAEQSPLRQLDDIIAVTKTSLKEQQEIRKELVAYKRTKEQYLQDKDDRQQLVRMVKSAHNLLRHIESQHLSHAFNAELMEELKFFSQIASKKGVPRPR